MLKSHKAKTFKSTLICAILFLYNFCSAEGVYSSGQPLLASLLTTDTQAQEAYNQGTPTSPYSITKYAWRRLLKSAEEPTCSNFQAQHKILFHNMNLIQENILQKNSNFPLNEYEHQLDQLIIQSEEFLSLEQVGFKHFFQVYLRTSNETMLRDFKKAELILAQNSNQIEPFELNRFIKIPWELKIQEGELSVVANVSSLDICQMKKVKIYLMNECQIQDNNAFECSKQKTCPPRRVTDWRTCKVQKSLIISLDLLAQELGLRSGSMRRQ